MPLQYAACCAPAMAQGVPPHSTRMEVTVEAHDVQKPQQFVHFTATQGNLIGSLDLCLPTMFVSAPDPEEDEDDQVEQLAADTEAALEQATAIEVVVAAAVRQAPRLRNLSMWGLSPAILLQAASSCSHLTCLNLHHWTDVHLGPQAPAQRLLLHQTAAALRQLVTLKKLVLSSDSLCVGVLLAATSSLTALTCIMFPDYPQEGNAVLQRLPTSLRMLQIGMCASHWPPVNLSHLTAVTYMSTESDKLLEMDVLPPRVEVLDIKCWDSTSPLLGLTRLRKLVVREAVVPAAQLQLQGLSSLQALSDISLAYAGWYAAQPAAAAWPQLPLLRLAVKFERSVFGDPPGGLLDIGRPTAAVMQQLSLAASLTCIQFSATSYQWNGETPHLAAALKQLTRLRELLLATWLSPSPHTYPHRFSRQQQAASWLEVVQVVWALPQLRKLGLQGLPWEDVPALRLCVAPGLTSLHLSGAVGESALLCLVGSCSNLLELDLANAVVSDAMLGLIAQGLPKLQTLSYACGAAVASRKQASGSYYALSSCTRCIRAAPMRAGWPVAWAVRSSMQP